MRRPLRGGVGHLSGGGVRGGVLGGDFLFSLFSSCHTQLELCVCNTFLKNFEFYPSPLTPHPFRTDHESELSQHQIVVPCLCSET